MLPIFLAVAVIMPLLSADRPWQDFIKRAFKLSPGDKHTVYFVRILSALVLFTVATVTLGVSAVMYGLQNIPMDFAGLVLGPWRWSSQPFNKIQR